jgi:tRNA pseudouridine13 synthase
MSSVCSEESNVGISMYAAPQVEGFSAVSKARYSDFIVHEVDLNGTVAQLKTWNDSMSVESKQDATIQPEPTFPDSCVDNVSSTTPTSVPTPVYSIEDTWNLARDNLAKLVGDQEAHSAMCILRFWEFSPTGEIKDQQAKNYTFSVIEDKQKRKQLHELFRSDLFSNYAVADTVDRCVRVWHKMFEKETPNYYLFNGTSNDTKRGPGNKRRPWPKDQPDYLKFVLYKENIDTTTAIKDIARILHIPSRGEGRGTQPSIGYAGMKDKRGITSQFCTVYRKTPQELEIINQSRSKHQPQSPWGGGHTQGGGASWIRVGGDYSYTTHPLELGKLSGNRFDIVLRNVVMDDLTHLPLKERVSAIKTRLSRSLQGFQDIGFVNYFGMQRFGKDHDTHEVGLAILKGNYEKACEIIMRVKQGDEASKEIRLKWQSRFAAVNMEDDQSVRDTEAKTAKLLLKQLGRFMNAEISIMEGLSRKPRDYRSAFLGIARHLRSMYLHSYQSCVWNKVASYRIQQFGSHQVVEGDLVLLSGDCNVDESTMTSWDEKKVKIVTAEDIMNQQYTIHDVVIPLVGSKVTYPTNVSNYIDNLLGDDGMDKEFFITNQDRETALRGDYRKLLCKPIDVDLHFILYKDSLQPLLQTDVMKLNGVSINNAIFLDGLELESMTDEYEPSMLGLTISFTLPQSAYATIALREFMKRPTSGKYQASLPIVENDQRLEVKSPSLPQVHKEQQDSPSSKL